MIADKYEPKIVFHEQSVEPFEKPIDPDMTTTHLSEESAQRQIGIYPPINSPYPERPKPEEVKAVVNCSYGPNNMTRPIEGNLTENLLCLCLALKYPMNQIIHELYCEKKPVFILPKPSIPFPPAKPGNPPEIPVQKLMNPGETPMIPKPTINKEASPKLLR
jgi:hypothetical protein